MAAKKVLGKLNKDQQEYYIFLAKECFSGFSNAEDNFNVYRYASCNTWLFHSSNYCDEFYSERRLKDMHQVHNEERNDISCLLAQYEVR